MAARKSSADGLDAYRAKRSADRTPEPFGGPARSAGRIFVVQKHAARRTHYDLRLEWGGVLHSWAVPKGPSPDPAEKRLAVQVEPHPVEYADFEGMIPEGNYGAGAVIVWDRGVWQPLEDPAEGMEKGKLLFDLRGYKLRGRWTLVRTKRNPKDWLLIKERDEFAVADGNALPDDSILSGRDVEAMKAGEDPAAPVLARLDELNAPRATVLAGDVELMLAETREKPFTRPGWVFELKYDGYRLVAAREDGRAVLRSRAGHDLTDVFPEVAQAVGALPFRHVVLDGEVVVHDERGLPSFQRLQQRGKLHRHLDIGRAAIDHPATLYAFDLLGFADRDVRPLSLETRKALLRGILPAVGPLRFSDHIAEQGEAMYAQVTKLGLEGIVAKKADAPYRGGRSPHWLKIRADKTDDFVVVGFTEPEGHRSGFGALHLAEYVGDELVYAGRVGSGFTGTELDAIRSALDGAVREDPPCTGPVPTNNKTKHRWVEPRVVCEVRYKERTDQGQLRHPVFVRFRDDKQPHECRRDAPDAELPEPAPLAPPPPPAREVRFSNLDKVFWPEEGYTKGDLIEYHRSIALWILPYLDERPLVLTRYPDGIHGKSFFQKDAPVFAPEWIRTERLWSEGSERDLNYFVCQDVESLLYIINLGAIPLHIWSSRLATLEQPDWCIIDLDPKEAPFEHVVEVALAVRELCDDIALPTFIKTSGSTGLHVLIPLGRQLTYEQSRTLGGLLGRVVADRLPEIATVTRQPTRRGGRVYLDHVQNGHGRLLVAPFCVRPLPGAPVSATLEWSEVTKDLNLLDYTIKTVPERMQRLGDDPMRAVLEGKPDLMGALNRLQERMGA